MSIMISGIGSNAARSLAAAADVKAAPEARQSGAEASARSRAPVVDEYIPDQKQEPSGR